MLQYREQYGPQGVAFLQGTIRGWSRVYSRLANAFGAVNHGAADWAQCLWPRLVENTVTFGATYTEITDFENTRCMLVWGDEHFSGQYEFWRPYVQQVIYRYLDCGDIHNGFARVKCKDCGHE